MDARRGEGAAPDPERAWTIFSFCADHTACLRQAATKDWANSSLAAFATVGQLTLVTFDRGLRAKVKSAILLG